MTQRKAALVKEIEAKLAGKPLDLSALSLGALLIIKDDVTLGLQRK